MKKLFWQLSAMILLMSNLFGTVYSDGTNPNDWKPYTSVKGEVKENNGTLEFTGNGKQGFYIPVNIKCKVPDNRYTVSWRMKSKRYSQVFVQIMTKNGIRYLSYYPLPRVRLGKSGRFLKFGMDRRLGDHLDSRDGDWHTYTIDVEADLHKYESDNEPLEIKAFFIRVSVLLDDVQVNTEVITDTEKFQKAVRKTNYYDGSEIFYFKNLGIGTTTMYFLTYNLTYFFAFSDENKNSVTKLDIRVESIPLFPSSDPMVFQNNGQMYVEYQCKYISHKTQCLDNPSEVYQDIYDVTHPLKPVLISSKIVNNMP